MIDIHIGNVIRDPEGSMWIVTEVDARVVQAVSFDSENCSATQLLEDSEHERTCRSCEYTDPYCEACGGKGSITIQVKGWKRSKVLAPNVKEFILRGVKKAFSLS